MRALALAMVTLVVLGCATGEKSFTKDVPKEVPQGYHEYDKPELGFYVAAPDNWRLNRPTAKMGMEMTDENGQPLPVEEPANVPSEEDAAKQAQEGLAMVLFDNNLRPTVAETMTQVQIKREDVGAVDIKAAEKQMKEKIASDGEVKVIELPIGPAVEGKRVFKNQIGDEVTELFYFIPNGQHRWQFKFISVNQSGVFDQAAPEIMRLVRIKPNG